jgi:dihydrofolate reductase
MDEREPPTDTNIEICLAPGQKRKRQMRRLIVFNNVTLDGYFADANGDMSWAHKHDPEWLAFVEENASGGGEFVFGRITYELMASYWPTPMAIKNDPKVAEGMNNSPKVVFSRTMDKASWNNTKVVKGDLAAEVRKMKAAPGKGLVIFGSGTIISQLAQESLIDEYQIVVNPVVLGKGRTMFDGVKKNLPLKLTKSRTFGNGNVFLCYEPVA